MYTLRCPQYLGGSTAGERGEKLFEELCQLWPPGSITTDSLRKVSNCRRLCVQGRLACLQTHAYGIVQRHMSSARSGLQTLPVLSRLTRVHGRMRC